MHHIQQIAIIGTGLLGGSLGLALRAAGWSGRIVGVGRRPQTLERAQQRGCIDAAVELAAAVANSQLIVMATPLGRFADLLRQIAARDHDQLVITDVGSVKQPVCAEARAALADPSRFVGAHPMAGSEQHGPDHATPDLFRDRLCILTPEGTSSSDRSVSVVRDLWSLVGARITVKTPAEHDHLMAVVSHLPHALAALLVNAGDKAGAMNVASTGFRDTTRIASGDPTVWIDIFKNNREAVIEAIDAISGDLGELRAALAAADDDKVYQLLSRAKDARDRWVKQGNSSPSGEG